MYIRGQCDFFASKERCLIFDNAVLYGKQKSSGKLNLSFSSLNINLNNYFLFLLPFFILSISCRYLNIILYLALSDFSVKRRFLDNVDAKGLPDRFLDIDPVGYIFVNV